MSKNYTEKDAGKTEHETTTAEKILAIALTIFLLIGGLRIAESINKAFPYPDYMQLREQYVTAKLESEYIQLQNKANELLMEVKRWSNIEETARLEYEKAREEYRTLLDKGIDDEVKKLEWEKARTNYEQAQEKRQKAEEESKNFQTEILAFKTKNYGEAEKNFQTEFSRRTNSRNFKAGISLLAYALLGFALSFFVYNFFRTRAKLSRYAVIGMSFLGFGAIQALIVSFRIAYPYLKDIIPVEGIISVGGSAISIAGIVYLKNRFFSLKAVQNRRLWRKACPICGFSDPGSFCPWCGTIQQVECPTCNKLTNKFLPYCQECGKDL